MAGKIPRKPVAALGEGSRLSDLAYRRILEVLLQRRLPIGSFVSQAELVALTGVPVGPLRDALRMVEAEGLVTIHPRAGIQFVKPGMELTRSTYQFRSIIESAAVVHFAESASDLEIEGLDRRHRAAIAQVETAGLSPLLQEELEALEAVLHGAIVGSLNNPLINSSYRRVRNYLGLIRLDRRITVPLVLRSLKEHMAIIEACRRRSPADAVAALQAHFAAALERMLAVF